MHFVEGSLSTPKQWKDYIDELVGKGLQIVIDTPNTDGNAPKTTPSVSTMGKLYLVTLSGQQVGTYTEFVTVNPSGSTYVWEKIGTTEADLTNYVKKGTYVTADGGAGDTGAAGAATITSSSAGAHTATGTATVSYQKADAKTGSAHGQTETNTGVAGAFTINGSSFSFAGKKATLTADVTGTSIDSHTYTPAGTINGLTQEAHSHTVNVAKGTTTVVTAQGAFSEATHGADSFTAATINAGFFSAGSLPTFTQGAKASLTYGASAVTVTPTTANFFNGATVSSTGVLSFNSSAAMTDASATTDASKITKWSANGSDTFNAGSTPSIDTSKFNGGSFTSGAFFGGSLGAATTTSITYVTGATTSTAGAISYAPVFTGTEATIAHTFTDGAQGSISLEYTPEGTIGGSASVANHSHTYNAPADHTHSIALTATTITGTASVAVGTHTHSVTIANHTHSIGNHTHSVSLQTPQA